jgi:hypothetical protein
MKRILVYISIAVLTLIVGLYAYLGVSNNTGHFWRKVYGAQVTSNGQIISSAGVYRSLNGMLLMNLGEDGWYVYWPQAQNIGSCNPITYLPIPGYIYAKDCDGKFCPCVEMGTAKVEVKAEIVVGQNFIEFNALNRERVHIGW